MAPGHDTVAGRITKDYRSGARPCPECNIVVPDKNPPCSLRYLFRLRVDRTEGICGEFSCMFQTMAPFALLRLAGRREKTMRFLKMADPVVSGIQHPDLV